MFARLVTMQAPTEKIVDRGKIFKEQVLPNVKKFKGFKKAYLLADRKAGKSHAIFIYDTEANLKATSAQAEKLRTQITQSIGAKILAVEELEVVAQS